MHLASFHPGGTALTKKAADTIKIPRGSHILDIGCGNGATLSLLSREYGCKVTGVDISDTAVQTAGHAVPEAEVFAADASSLPFDDSRFDAVFMECTLTLFDDPEKALTEARRVLKPLGHLVLSALTENGPKPVNTVGADKDRLISFLHTIGFSEVSYSDEKDSLTQFYCDILFEFGSLDEYVKHSEAKLGGSILNCKKDLNSLKHLGYGLFICMAG